MSEWTAEKLDALPEGTVIGWTEGTYPEEAVRQGRSWRTLSGLAPYGEGVIEDADPGSIRVVSVPIDALMSEGALDAAWDTFDRDGHNGIDCRPEKSMSRTVSNALRAAINHATRKEGEA